MRLYISSRSKEVSRSLGLAICAATALVGRPSVQRRCILLPFVSGREMTRHMARCKSARSPVESTRAGANRFTGGGDFRGAGLRDVGMGLQGLVVDLVERGNLVVPLEQRGGDATELRGVGVELPDRVEHRVVVRIEDVLLEL